MMQLPSLAHQAAALEADAWLAADPRAVERPLQPRVLGLPVAQQHDLALSLVGSCCCTSNTPTTTTSCATPPPGQVLQLLQLLCSTACPPHGSAAQQAADCALQHLHSQFGASSSVNGLYEQHLCCPKAAAPMPDWLAAAPAAQHCFAWLHQPSEAPQQHTADARAVQQDSGTQRQGQVTAAAAAEAAAAAAADGQDAGPALPKRRKLAATQMDATAVNNSTPTEPASSDAATSRLLEQALQQLQALAAGGDAAANLDMRALWQVLAAGAANALEQQQQQQLQQSLQQLSPDAALTLLQAHLVPVAARTNATDGDSSNSGSGSSSSSRPDGPGLAFLLHAMLLPQLQALTAAAPQALLVALVFLGNAGGEPARLLEDVLLRPLVASARLLPVQVQLLLKLAKSVPGMQASVLQLLLAAALGSGSAAAPAAGAGGCCWREPHVALTKGLLNASPAVVAQQLDAVINALRAAVQQRQLAQSSGFGQLLMALVKAHGGVLSGAQLAALQDVAAATSSFLTKALGTRLAALQQKQQQA